MRGICYDGRLTNCSAPGYEASYAYSATGQRTNMADASGTTAWYYDDLNQLTNKTVAWNHGPTVGLNYAYNAFGDLTNLWSSTAGGVSNAYQYDLLGRLTNVLAGGVSIAGYGYDAVGNLQSLGYGNGVTNLYEYDSMNRLTNLVWKLNGSPLAGFAYTLGPTGNRMALAGTVNGTSRDYTWSYDYLYRLTSEGIGNLGTVNYGLDAVGNRTNRTSTVSGIADQTLAYDADDRLQSDTYDPDGNTVVSGPNVYQYDALDHLTNVNNGQILLAYNGDGERMSKTVGGVTTYYLVDDQNPSGYVQVLEEYQGSTLSKVYNYGLALISQRQVANGTVSYYGYDGQGSTRFLMDSSGNITDTYLYDAYGTLLSSTGTTPNNYLYDGQQWDSDLGLYYNRARYLNTDTGRFWTMDTFGGDNQDPLSLHKYLYGAGDPVNHIDPSGNDYATWLVIRELGWILPSVPLYASAMSKPDLEDLALSPSITVVFSVDKNGVPRSFHASYAQRLLQTQLNTKVFNDPPAGHSVTIKVREEASAPGKLGWSGTPKSTYYNRVTWHLNGTISSRSYGAIQISPEKVGEVAAFHSRNLSDQTWVNIFAHEGIWGNAGGNFDAVHFFGGGTLGDISEGSELGKSAYLFTPFVVTPASRATLRKEFGF